jgi:four helix bundle protein
VGLAALCAARRGPFGRASALASWLLYQEGSQMSLPHHKLVAWQRADDLFIEVHRLTLQCFPHEEKYELGRQIRKSAYSVPANVVEGNARDTTRETLRFFNIASASLSETGYGLHAAHRLGYISDQIYEALERQIISVAAPLNGLIKKKRAALLAKVTANTGAIAFLAMQFLQWAM